MARRKTSIDPLIEHLGKSLTGLARRAVALYAPMVDALVDEDSRDVQAIERTLDGLLDFGFDHEALRLYRRLCRHYFAFSPAAAAQYVAYYREMWDAGPGA